jgi:hypothetical protein
MNSRDMAARRVVSSYVVSSYHSAFGGANVAEAVSVVRPASAGVTGRGLCELDEMVDSIPG